MCCIVGSMFAFGPRLALIIWWLFDTAFFRDSFSAVFWPIVGLIFAPWTTLFFLFAQLGTPGVAGWDYVLIVIGILLDLASYSGNAWKGRKRFA